VADLTVPVLIVNARIATGVPRRPWADAVVCDGPTVVAIGSSAELRKRFGAEARVVNAQGAIIDMMAPSALQLLSNLSTAAD